MKFRNDVPVEFYLFLIVVAFIIIIVKMNPDDFDNDL